MRNLIAIILCLIAASWSGVQAQNRAGTFAAAATPTTPVPSQPQPAATPQAGSAPTPGLALPRPAGQAPAAGQQPQDQLRVVADPATNSLIIYGTAQEFQNIKNILKELDAVPRQVLIEAMILQIDLSDSEDFGVDYELYRSRPQTIFGQTFNSIGAIRSLGELFPPAPFFAGAPGLSAVAGGKTVSALVRAAATDSRVKIISSPSVIASDNKPARIQVGSEEPIPTGTLQAAPTSTDSLSTSTSIQYRNTGRILTIIPQVNSQGLVNLQLKAEVSSRGEDAQVGNQKFPAFNTQDAETTAVVQDGETLIIGGLIGERKSKGRSGIPYLMDIPVIGRFFGTANDSSTRTELIMLITPRVIRTRDESRQVTADFKAGLEKVRTELERIGKERERLLPPRPLPPLPDPNQYYQFDPLQRQLVPENPPAAPRAALPNFTGEVMVLANDPLSRRMMPPMLVPLEPMALAVAPVTLAPEQAVAPRALEDSRPQLAAADLPAPYILSSFAAMAPSVASPTASDGARPPASSKALVGKRFWTVQVAAISEKNAAESLAEKLRRLGYKGYVVVTQGVSRSWHRVRVGQLASHKEAAALRDLLSARKEYQNAYVVTY